MPDIVNFEVSVFLKRDIHKLSNMQHVYCYEICILQVKTQTWVECKSLPGFTELGICCCAARNIFVDVSKNCRAQTWSQSVTAHSSLLTNLYSSDTLFPQTYFTFHMNTHQVLTDSVSHLCYSGLFLLELTKPQDANSRLIMELLIKWVEQLHMLSKPETQADIKSQLRNRHTQAQRWINVCWSGLCWSVRSNLPVHRNLTNLQQIQSIDDHRQRLECQLHHTGDTS